MSEATGNTVVCERADEFAAARQENENLKEMLDTANNRIHNMTQALGGVKDKIMEAYRLADSVLES